MARRTWLIRIREGLGLSQLEAAMKIGFSENYLRGIETGRMPLTDSAMVKIARGYAVSLDSCDRQRRRARSQGAAA